MFVKNVSLFYTKNNSDYPLFTFLISCLFTFLYLGGKGFNNKVEFVNHQAQPTCNFLTTSDVTYKCDKCEDKFNNVKGILFTIFKKSFCLHSAVCLLFLLLLRVYKTP